jgi:glycosyltransferase involved in cell wall biosynthesis
MKILHVNTFDRGGAAIACRRLHDGLLEKGVQSDLLVRDRSRKHQAVHQFVPSQSDRIRAKMRRVLFELRLAQHPTKNTRELEQTKIVSNLPAGSEYFSFPDTRFDITNSPLYQAADIVNLHWVADFIDYPGFFAKNTKPVVWTLHDMAAFQGGTHYQEKFLGVDRAGNLLPRSFDQQLSDIMRENLAIKKKAFEKVTDLHIVSPSNWLATQSQRSELLGRFPHSVIPYGVDSTVFKTLDKKTCREILGLPADKLIILFVADSLTNFRKGFSLLVDAFNTMKGNDDVLLCAIGSDAPQTSSLRTFSLGRIDDERLMSVAYNAADVFVIPSIEDNFPNTVLEAHMCGLPVIGFPAGGIREMIDDGRDGILAGGINTGSLQAAITRFIETRSSFDRSLINQDAHAKFALSVQAKEYMKLYNNILGENPK